jgi:hypothetical protein
MGDERTKLEKLEALVEAAKYWRYWQRQPVTRSIDESKRRSRAQATLLAAIDDVCGDTPVSPDVIECPRCGRRSWNPQDITEGYCGHCHDWTSPPLDERMTP